MAAITVLGLDPGSRNTGWGIVREESGVLTLVDTGVIRVECLGEMDVRLGAIFDSLSGFLARHKPDEAAMEDVFVSKNVSSALKLGQARGAAMAACAVAGRCRTRPISIRAPSSACSPIRSSWIARMPRVPFTALPAQPCANGSALN